MLEVESVGHPDRQLSNKLDAKLLEYMYMHEYHSRFQTAVLTWRFWSTVVARYVFVTSPCRTAGKKDGPEGIVTSQEG